MKQSIGQTLKEVLDKNPQLSEDAWEVIVNRSFLKICDYLSKEEIDTLADLTDPEKIDQFLRSKVPNLEQLVKEETEQYLKEMEDLLNLALSR